MRSLEWQEDVRISDARTDAELPSVRNQASLIRHDSNASAIARAIGHIRGDMRSPIAIPDLARRVGMSASSFHKHFKAITSTTPLQYQKELHLLEARQLPKTGGASVSTTAFDVGYESPTQFSREYARKFGIAPSQDTANAAGSNRTIVDVSSTIVYSGRMLKELGKALNQARESSRQSLEGVAGPAKISATYLQKLERGQVENPSPRVLARLAGVLDIPYLRLMQLAGYLDDVQGAQIAGRPPEPHPLKDAGLTPDEWHALGDFIKALKARRTKP